MAVLYEKYPVDLTETLQVTIPLRENILLRDLLYEIESDDSSVVVYISTEQADYRYCMPVKLKTNDVNPLIEEKWRDEINSKCDFIRISTEKPVNLYLTLKTKD